MGLYSHYDGAHNHSRQPRHAHDRHSRRLFLPHRRLVALDHRHLADPIRVRPSLAGTSHRGQQTGIPHQSRPGFRRPTLDGAKSQG